MKRHISLYVADKKVDLDDNSLILFNYTMSDLTNPTIVKNSFSKQITLKGTPTNNKLFGSIFRLDRRLVYTDSYEGVNFDPMRKTPFVIYDENGEILESGYLKLNGITRNGIDVVYNISLFGGLGSFFYGLSYHEDGSKKSLVDLKYPDPWGSTTDFKNQVFVDRGKYTYKIVSEAWDVMLGDKSVGGVVDAFWDVINFAPAYNGLPKDFDADRAIHVYNQFQNSRYDITDSSSLITYGTKSNAGNYVLTTFTNDHTEWEVRDLRWYLQRPVISIKKIIEAICLPENNGGYSVELDETFFKDENAYYGRLWMTLPMIAKEDRINASPFIPNLLKATHSPADYLLSYIKLFGLVVICDSKEKVVKIMRRETWYDKHKNSIIDITDRINKGASISIEPVVANAKIYQLGQGAEGEFAEDYKTDYGIPYGVHRINTGYEFAEEEKILTSDIVFSEAAEVLERNRMYIYIQYPGLMSRTFPLPGYEVVETELWGTQAGSQEKSENFRLSASVDETSSSFHFINPDVPYGDQFSKVQLHEKDNDPMDGANVLLFYDKVYESASIPWLITQDIDAQSKLNGDKPCWNLSPQDAEQRYRLPMFKRFLCDSTGTMRDTLDYGMPLAVGVPGVEVSQPETISENFWNAYLSDLYDGGTTLLKCKVNLRGLSVGVELLRRFYWYDNAIWVLNKISNYSITTFDEAECEFVKVQNINNYR